MIHFLKRCFSNSKRVLFFILFLPFLLIVWSNFSVYFESKDYISNDLSKMPKTKVGLLLGTSRYLKNNSPNAYFFNRIDATVKLFKSGKIQHVLVSGDNGTKEYNEPEDMKTELIARGIPENKITLDFAGFDTYDSMIRAQRIFGQNKFIVVSQHFHNQRAVYIARRFGIDAYGFDAGEVKKHGAFLTKLREYFACVKAYVEVKASVDPTFLGKEEII